MDSNRKNPPELIAEMDQKAFIRVIERARIEAAQTTGTSDELAMWMKRLQPFFEKQPDLTVLEALELYRESLR